MKPRHGVREAEHKWVDILHSIMHQHACGSGCGHSHDPRPHSHHSTGRTGHKRSTKAASKAQNDQERMELEERQALGK